MFEGKKFVVLSTSNIIGGMNLVSFLSFFLLAFLLYLSALGLFLLSKRDLKARHLAISLKNLTELEKKEVMKSSLTDSESIYVNEVSPKFVKKSEAEEINENYSQPYTNESQNTHTSAQLDLL